MVCSKNPSRKAMGHPRGLKPRLFVMGALSRGLKGSLPDLKVGASTWETLKQRGSPFTIKEYLFSTICDRATRARQY
jgi:hypothetical protein